MRIPIFGIVLAICFLWLLVVCAAVQAIGRALWKIWSAIAWFLILLLATPEKACDGAVNIEGKAG